MMRNHLNFASLFVLIALLVADVDASDAYAQMISPNVPPPSVSTENSSTSSTPPKNCDVVVPGQPTCEFTANRDSEPAPATLAAPSLAGGSAPTGSGGLSAMNAKVLTYFQRGLFRINTEKAFGFVLMPRSAITAQEKNSQVQFCEIALATMDFLTPGAAANSEALPTYWPIVSYINATDVERAFNSRDCNNLIAWYDHSLARNIAAKSGLIDKSGPILITWPSKSALYDNPRDPLIVDFANADYAHATKALRYWFRQASRNPKLWRSYIREGTLRSELADAINDTAGVMLAVLSGKWNSLSAIGGTPQ